MKKNIYLIGILLLPLFMQAQQKPSVKGFNSTENKDATTFSQDICGVWASAFSTDKDAIPYLVFEVFKRDTTYECRISPYCTLAKEYGMYNGGKGNYKPKGFENQGKKQDYPYSFSHNFIPENNQIVFNFGNEKFRKGLNQKQVDALTETVDNAVKSTTEMFKSPAFTYKEAAVGTAVAQTAGLAAELLIVLASDSKKTNILLDVNIQQAFPGCVDMELTEINVSESTSGYKKEAENKINFRMFKLYPEYNVIFATKDNELFGSTNKDETQIKEEYKEVTALKDKGVFNRKNYKKLSDKVSEYYYLKEKENPNDQDLQIMTVTVLEDFENGNRGLIRKKYVDVNNSSVEGWMNMKGKLEGFCVIKNSNGAVYEGEVKNNEFSEGTLKYADGGVYTGSFANGKRNGNGTLTYPNGNVYKGNFVNGERNGNGTFTYKDGSVYTGNFVNGSFNGNGTLTYSDGAVFEGIFKNGYIQKGKMVYANGNIYDGDWKYNEKTKRSEQHGKGKFINAVDSSVFEGMFKNGERNGKGKVIYAKGVFEGIYKDGYRQKGKMVYTNGDIYDGDWKYNEKTELSERHGKGTMKYANGEIVSGQWENNELITKK